MTRFVKKSLLGVTLIFGLLVILLIARLTVSPNPLFQLAKWIPVEAEITPPDLPPNAEESVRVVGNLEYSQAYDNSFLDLYLPAQQEGKVPVVVFLHGGGFFKGDKEMAKYFGPALSAGRYAFASLNYTLAPDATIFEQLKQVNEALRFLKEKALEYGLDLTQVNMAGSSAGGFLALQLLSSYFDPAYQQALALSPVSDIHFASILLYSAVYDLSVFQEANRNPATNYFLSKIGWGLTGRKNWQEDQEMAKLLNLTYYIADDFPPFFITDGNTRTFLTQAQAYAHQLTQHAIPNQTLFFSNSKKVKHGYQLQMDTEESRQAVEASLTFLEKWNQ